MGRRLTSVGLSGGDMHEALRSKHDPVRQLVLLAAYLVPAALFLFGGSLSSLGWVAIVVGMVWFSSREAREARNQPGAQVVAERWQVRFLGIAALLACKVVLAGIDNNERWRVLDREMASICANWKSDDLCDQLDEARQEVGAAGALSGSEGEGL